MLKKIIQYITRVKYDYFQACIAKVTYPRMQDIICNLGYVTRLVYLKPRPTWFQTLS